MLTVEHSNIVDDELWYWCLDGSIVVWLKLFGVSHLRLLLLLYFYYFGRTFWVLHSLSASFTAFQYCYHSRICDAPFDANWNFVPSIKSILICNECAD